jgi:hypothetical protein
MVRSSGLWQGPRKDICRFPVCYGGPIRESPNVLLKFVHSIRSMYHSLGRYGLCGSTGSQIVSAARILIPIFLITGTGNFLGSLRSNVARTRFSICARQGFETSPHYKTCASESATVRHLNQSPRFIFQLNMNCCLKHIPIKHTNCIGPLKQHRPGDHRHGHDPGGGTR